MAAKTEQANTHATAKPPGNGPAIALVARHVAAWPV